MGAKKVMSMEPQSAKSEKPVAQSRQIGYVVSAHTNSDGSHTSLMRLCDTYFVKSIASNEKPASSAERVAS